VAWSQLEAATPPRVAASAVHISGVGPGRIVWIGGYDDVEALARVGVLDLASGSWSEAPPLPEGRAYASAVAHEGRIFVVGGTDGRNTAPLDRVYVSEHDSTGAITGWRVAGALAGARWGGAAFVLVRDGTPYVFVTAGHVGMTLGTQVLRAPIGNDGTLGEFVESGQDMPVALAGPITYVCDFATTRLHGFDTASGALLDWLDLSSLYPEAGLSGLVYDAARDRLYVAAKGANRVLAIDAHAAL
jgi:hypothetical protein